MIFKSLLLGLTLFTNYAFAEKVYIKDWQTGFETREKALTWCYELAESWRVDMEDWEKKYCEVSEDKDPYGNSYGYSVVFYLGYSPKL